MNLTLNCFDWSECVLNTNLPSNSKYLALYLATFMNKKNDMAWPSQSRISHDTGLTEPTIRKHLKLLNDNGWLVTKKQIRTINTGTQNYHCNEYHISFPKQFEHIVNNLPSDDSRGKIDTEQGVNESRTGGKQFTTNNNRITKNNNGRFTPPTLTEIKVYCNEKNSSVDPEKFFYFYESKNWMIGKNKMKSWKSAIATWERSDVRQTNDSPYALGAI